MEQPKLLRIPEQFNSVRDVLGAAEKLDLPNVLVLSELENGSIVFLDSGLTMSAANWLIDRLKHLMLEPDQRMRP
jgi:hypothetical protein